MSDYPVELERIAKQFGMTGDEMLAQIASGELIVSRAIDIDSNEEDRLPPAMSMDEISALARELDFSHEDLEEIANAIKEARRVDPREW